MPPKIRNCAHCKQRPTTGTYCVRCEVDLDDDPPYDCKEDESDVVAFLNSALNGYVEENQRLVALVNDLTSQLATGAKQDSSHVSDINRLKSMLVSSKEENERITTEYNSSREELMKLNDELLEARKRVVQLEHEASETAIKMRASLASTPRGSAATTPREVVSPKEHTTPRAAAPTKPSAVAKPKRSSKKSVTIREKPRADNIAI